MLDLLIRNGLVVDGSGGPGREADVAVRGDRIVEVGQLGEASADKVIDAEGQVIAPGFIDVHTHSDAHLLCTQQMTSKTRQGFTTELIMLDGLGYAPVSAETVTHWIHYLRPLNGLSFDGYTGWSSIADYMTLLDRRTVHNVATHIPYANVRSLAAGFGRGALDDFQHSDVQRLVRRGMEEGAVGLSTGLDYAEQCFASTEELISACRPMSGDGGLYVTHVRYELGTLQGVREAVRIGREAGVPVHISHLKGATMAESEAILSYIDDEAVHQVDFSFDVYPYVSSSTMLQYLLPHEVWRRGPLSAMSMLGQRRLRDAFGRKLADRRLDQIKIAWLAGRWNQGLIGLSLADYVAKTAKAPADALCDLLLEEGMRVLLVFRADSEQSVEPFLQHRCFVMGSDGILFGDGAIHPRQYGSAARLLGHFARERGLLTLEQAVHAMTGRAAHRFGLKQRGVLASGNFADIVIFDPGTVADLATFDQPQQHAIGVRDVVVNGQMVVREGEALPADDSFPGRYLRFKESS